MSGKVLIRADGSKTIGMGHIHRSSLLADMFKKKFNLNSVLLMRKDSAALEYATKRGLLFQEVPVLQPQEEGKWIKEYAVQNNIVLCVLDILDNDQDADFIGQLKSLKCPIVAITDDSNQHPIDADIIVNGNPNQIGYDYTNYPGTYLLGAKYFLMDERYSNFLSLREPHRIQRILLTLGGSDHNNLMFRVIEALQRLQCKKELVIVASIASGYIDRLKNVLLESELRFQMLLDVPSLVDLWPSVDVAITAGGNTLFERIAAGKPGVTICQLPRQMEIAECFERMGVNKDLGFGTDLSVESLAHGLKKFLEDEKGLAGQASLCRQVCAGEGLNHLAQSLRPIVLGEKR